MTTSPLGSVRTLNAGDAAKTGIAGGLSKSSDKLTDFYLAFILRAVRTADRVGNAIPREAAEKLVALAQNLQPSAC